MLKLILGTDWVANRDEILTRIASDVRNGLGGRILMVPELISHDMERRLCATAGDSASRYAEVLSFTRLARRVSDGVGSAARECLDNGGRVVAMASAAQQLHSQLKAYASVETRPEFLTGLVDAVDEFKRCCITSADLMEASRKTDGAFSQKLLELSLLLEGYDSLCSRGKRDPRDQMTWLLEQLCDSDFAAKHHFYIDGFPDFTRQHFAILEHLLQASPCVTVSLTCDRPGSSALAFEKVGSTASDLLRAAKQYGIPVEIIHIPHRETPLSALHSKVFQGSTELPASVAAGICTGRTDTLYSECQIAADRVRELVKNGSRYRDISIVCTDIAAYQDTLELVFNRCGIPLYRSGTEDVLEKPVVTTVLSAMEAALGGFDRQDVLRYLKSYLSPVSRQLCDELENYAYIWAVTGNAWLSDWVNHPDGLGMEPTVESEKRLAALNEARREAMQPLAALQRGFREATNLRSQVKALCAFFEDIRLCDRLNSLADEMDDAGENREAQILNQLWEIILSALEQMYDVLGDMLWEPQNFVRLFTLLLSQYDVGTIPPVLDAVMAGPVSAMRCQQVKHLIVLGAVEGALPSYCGSSGVLTDQERVALQEMGVPLTGGSMDGLQAEFSEIYGVFCGAEESVTVTCAGAQPSFVFRRMAAMSGESLDSPVTVVGDAMDVAACLVGTQSADAADELGLNTEYKAVKDRSSYSLGAVEPDAVRQLYGNKLRLSASQVDRQAECRFGYFLKYGLRAQERKEAAVDPAEFGTYVHAVLEHTAREVMKLGGFHAVSLEQTMTIAMAYSDEYARQRFSQLDSQRVAYLFQRNIQELAMVVRELWEELHTSEFSPVEFELAFGDGRAMPAINISGGALQAQLRGFVDRVDAWKNGESTYFRVVDYKTGRKDFDYCDVFNGIGLQMLLYLFALEQEGGALLGEGPIPAGVQYFPARCAVLPASGRLSEDAAMAEHGKNSKRKGLVLSDEAVLAAMEPEGSPKRLSCKVSKDGTLTGDIADRQQLRLLRDYVFRLLAGMVDDIASGNVTPNPYTRGSSHSACTYCPYQQVCHFASVEGRRNYKTMTAQRFWDEIGKEMHRG